MKNLAIILLIILAPILALGQAMGEIKGQVLNQDKEPIPMINVYVQAGGSTFGTTTDFDGKYTIKPLKPGIYNVIFSGIGFNKSVYNEVEVNPDNITFIPDMVMKESVTTTDVVEIYEYVRPQIQKEAGKIQILAAEFENSPAAKNPTKLISSMSSEISEGTDGQLYFRGSRGGAVQYIVDGVKLQSQLNTMPSSAIGSISVYTGGVPAKYGDLTGGVIVIETKNYLDFYNKEMARRRK